MANIRASLRLIGRQKGLARGLFQREPTPLRMLTLKKNGLSPNMSVGFRMLSTEDTESKKTQEEEGKEETTEETKEEQVVEEKSETEQLQEKLQALEEELAEAKDDRLRAYAEMENVRQRARRDIDNGKRDANKKFAKSLLGVLDNLERALASVPEELRTGDNNPEVATLYEGVAMTETELSKVFTANGVKAFGEEGDAFDPHKHEAMFQMPHDEYEPNTIAQVIEKGYMYKDGVLRVAKVGTVQGK